MEKLLKVSSSPHVRDGVTTQRLMFDVVIAMIPASVYGVWQFGMNALLVLIATVIASVAAEYLYEKLMHKPITISDGSAVVTGMILALNMPPEIPVWIPVLGAFFAIIVVKQLYGGLGQNFMNPALAARCFLLTSFALFMNNFSSAKLGFDSLTGATPLAQLRAGETVDLASLVIGCAERFNPTDGRKGARATAILARASKMREAACARLRLFSSACSTRRLSVESPKISHQAKGSDTESCGKSPAKR